MGITDFFGGQFIDVIRWENPEDFLLVKKFDRPLDEIKDDATLIVDPGYAAILVHNGKIEAIQDEPGKWSLDTENLPFITSFKNILRGMESPDKAAVYFLKTTEILNQKWGTKNPVKYMDPTYSFPVKLRSFGNHTFKISDIENFWTRYIGTKNEVTVDEMRNVINDRMLQYITDAFAEMNLSYIEIDKHRSDIGKKIQDKVNSKIGDLGLEVTDFRLEDINFTEETEELISKVSQQTAQANSINQMKGVDKEAMQNYKQTEQLDAMSEAASNEGTGGDMMGAFVGMNMGQQMGQQMGQNMSGGGTDQQSQDQGQGQNQNQGGGGESTEDKLTKIKNLLDQGLITQEEYEQKKKDLLDSI